MTSYYVKYNPQITDDESRIQRLRQRPRELVQMLKKSSISF
ncbi:5790_t:CDS:1, partial [Gigaspora rosea]